VVHQHGCHHQLLAHLHHWHIYGTQQVLSNIHHHSLARLIHRHGHGQLLVVGACLWHYAILCGRGWLLPSRASRRVVGIGQTLLRVLLLLGAMIGWSVARSQGQDVLCILATDPPMMFCGSCWGCAWDLVCLTLHWCDCCHHHHHGSDSSSNSPTICRDWEDDECSAVDHHPYCRNSWLVVMGNHHCCPDRHRCACCGW
jgi:hypothetical protein